MSVAAAARAGIAGLLQKDDGLTQRLIKGGRIRGTDRGSAERVARIGAEGKLQALRTGRAAHGHRVAGIEDDRLRIGP